MTIWKARIARHLFRQELQQIHSSHQLSSHREFRLIPPHSTWLHYYLKMEVIRATEKKSFQNNLSLWKQIEHGE